MYTPTWYVIPIGNMGIPITTKPPPMAVKSPAIVMLIMILIAMFIISKRFYVSNGSKKNPNVIMWKIKSNNPMSSPLVSVSSMS